MHLLKLVWISITEPSDSGFVKVKQNSVLIKNFNNGLNCIELPIIQKQVRKITHHLASIQFKHFQDAQDFNCKIIYSFSLSNMFYLSMRVLKIKRQSINLKSQCKQQIAMLTCRSITKKYSKSITSAPILFKYA